MYDHFYDSAWVEKNWLMSEYGVIIKWITVDISNKFVELAIICLHNRNSRLKLMQLDYYIYVFYNWIFPKGEIQVIYGIDNV